MRFHRAFWAVALGVLCLTGLHAQKNSGPKWRLAYSWEEGEGTFTITALKFASPQRGVAAGYITEIARSAVFGSHPKVTPAALVTANGGTSWTRVDLKAVANALFFLDDSTGWLVAEDGVWVTNEAGRSWKKIASVKGLNDVNFLTREHGFAVGSGKRVLETQDGGANWKPVTIEPDVKTSKDSTEFNALSFSNNGKGMILGQSYTKSSADDEPVWLHPEADSPAGQRQIFFVTTEDQGKHWKSSSQPMYGEPDQVSLGENGLGLVLFNLPRSSPFPSEVFRLDLEHSGNQRVFRMKERAITDVLANPGGAFLMAGYEPPGHVHPSPIPGKVKILRSDDMKHWDEMPVDYRAVARNVILASARGGALWAATDTGMILRWEE